ncbi:MAG: DUF4115 domain-containing protein [Sphingomonadaceae bacterium]|nr:DUF4115 domain-containing protein [Sphingomonadaceae bacterium]
MTGGRSGLHDDDMAEVPMNDAAQGELLPLTPGEKMRAAREAAGLSHAAIAEMTRVPQRMIDALERNAFDELPTGPYAVGFTRSIARALGLNEGELTAEVQALRHASSAGLSAAQQAYEPADTNRIPTRALAWTSVAIAAILFAAFMLWRGYVVGGDLARADNAATSAARPAATPANAAAGAPNGASPTTSLPAPPPAPPALANAPVRIAASERTWFSLTDAAGNSQFDLTLDGGEFYTVRPNQRALFLRTGRPQSLRILLGDQRLPQLGANDAVVSGVALDAASLAQRLSAQPAAAPPTVPGASQ